MDQVFILNFSALFLGMKIYSKNAPIIDQLCKLIRLKVFIRK